MRTAIALSATAVLCAGLTGCGDEDTAGGGPEPSSPGTSTTIDTPPTLPTPTTPTTAAAFPLTVTRKGGIVGFNDSLVPPGSSCGLRPIW